MKLLRDGVQLMNHQKTAIEELQKNKSYILNMACGLGKSLTILYHIGRLLADGDIKTCLIVAPKSALGAFERDYDLFTDDIRTLFKNSITLVNYESVWRGKYEQVYDLILLDEVHKISNRSSKQSKWLLKKALSARYRYAMTGTLVSNSKLEGLWSIITFLHPVKGTRSIYGKVWASLTGGNGGYYDWCNKYAVLNQYHQPYKYLHVDEIQKTIDNYSYSVLTNNCLDLPDTLTEVRYIDLKEKKLYNEMAKESTILEEDILADNPMSKMLYLRQICSGCMDLATKKLKTNKVDALVDLLDEIGEEKLVIFYAFTESMKQIEEVLKKRKIKYTTQNGKSDRNNWRTFQADESTKVILVQYISGNSGIDLYKSHITLYYEPQLSSNVFEQSKYRTNRKGQTDKCVYIHFITKGTVEEHIYKTLEKHKDFTEKLFTETMETYQRTYNR